MALVAGLAYGLWPYSTLAVVNFYGCAQDNLATHPLTTRTILSVKLIALYLTAIPAMLPSRASQW